MFLQKEVMMYVRTSKKNEYKSKCTPDIIDRTYKLCLLGLREKDLALAFGVGLSSIDYWKQQKPEFMDALTRGRQEADSRVAEALYQRAIGYSHPDTHITTAFNKETQKTEVIVTPIIKHYPPDSWACLKWLSMRQKELWAEVQKVEHTFNGQLDHYFVDQLSNPKEFTDQELQVALKMGFNKVKQLQMVNDN